MTTYPVRLFERDEDIVHLGEGLLACSLTRPEWTHEAHLGATAYLLLRRPDVDLDEEMPGLIRRFNESVGGINDDTQGYHDTVTMAYLAGVRAFLAKRPKEEALTTCVNALLMSPVGRRDWPLQFYSKDRLFSVEARRSFIAPDLKPLP
ncbi:hypothetical protein [Sphingomicrobium marinum]|uniref:hypothetical protein n=1 Tax=Sphingomicrobium marinum TaxID=1227950 RepID=UPI00223EF7E6|nr:hypothetical protein [Sphingomicrobium marinum]